MDRQIKFRAKSVHESENEWIYGGGVQKVKDKFFMFYLNHMDLPTVTEIDPESVGQFTGLYDRNGTEIYEGDVVNYWTLEEARTPYVTKTVSWSPGRAGWNIGTRNPVGNTKYEIIGNIEEGWEES